MSDANDENKVRLRYGSVNQFGATFWTLKMDTRFDGRAKGGLLLEVDIHTQAEGLRIAGELITWEDLLKAKAYADSKVNKKE